MLGAKSTIPVYCGFFNLRTIASSMTYRFPFQGAAFSRLLEIEVGGGGGHFFLVPSVGEELGQISRKEK